ncbi:hypothetical protein PFISCL1PPCAC_5773 [Pristionchus fissidentatus]|uniref:Uncharacterized protein n=1 Tax=Pristionchus fissidentatus TaxID=1538716 RepID=A0AAV5V4G0_9BILA|nr:hypothetical protein PFISCL1PPCAC_5773 [Pristionchus fissidentatus]
MNSLYCCAPCKPRYRKLVDNIYPRAINEGLINMQMQKLTFYAISHPEKLERIGEYLVQRLARDLARLRFVQVKIAVEAMDQLLEACHSSPSLVQFTENHLRMVQKLLESNIPVMEQLATTSFVKFSNIEENTPSYHRQYDFFISKFSQMCHSSHDEHWKVMRCAGLRGLRGVVWKSVTDGLHPTIWERQHMDKIVPSILFNLHEGDDDSCSGEEVLTGRNAFTSLVDENERDRDDPHTLSDQCLRELMGKATFGSMRAVMDPLLKHLDLHKKWQPPPNFAISLFKAILYSIQTQNSYFVIQELINHLDTMSSSNAKIRIGIATVLSSIVNIAGTSIGPLLLSIFNSLLKHLRTSVEFQQSYSCPNKEDETTYQETLINAMGDFANALPDYQKVEMMMFTVGNIPSLNNTNESSKSSDAFLQHVLVKTLLKVATKYRTAYLATVFTDSFLATLLRLALACDPQVRLNTLYIFHTLLDRHDNIHSLIHLGCELDVSDLQLTVEKCSRADQMFIRKHTNHLLTTLYKCVVKEGEGAELEERLDAIQCILCLLCIEVGYDEMLLELFRLSLSLQDYAADPTQKISDEKRMRVHNIVAKFLNVSSQLMALPSLCQHVQQIVANRASHGPPLMNLVEGVVESSEEGEIRLRVDEMDEKSGMLFDRGVISECLKASGKDTSRLVVPFSLNLSSLMPSSASSGPSLSLSPSGWEEEEDSRGKGEKREIDVDSLDLSFDVSPPETPSMRTTRRNTTVFSLLPNKTGLPVSVQALRTMVNTPVDAVEEEKRMMEMTSSVVEQLRSRPFEDISDEICKHNEEGDIVRTVSRLLARNSESVRLSEMGRTGGARPKDIFEIQLPPSYIY